MADFDAAFVAPARKEGAKPQQPFPWQRALRRRRRDGEPVATPDVPTGLGETAAMAVWLMAREAGAAPPRRLVYVVDRRAVVDQATAYAERLRRTLATTPDLAASPGLRDTASPISTLRSGFADTRDRLRDPASCAIIVGAVDRIGARLLFSGQGVSRGIRPMHAAPIGCDTLVMLDKAHLSQPFGHLLTGARRGSERDRAAVAHAKRGFLAGERVGRTAPAFLVATAAGAVGVDLYADAMVCDLASWERMAPRLCRVTRRGDLVDGAPVVVMDLTAADTPKRPDQIGERERLGQTRTRLGRLPTPPDGTVQAGPGAIMDLLRRALIGATLVVDARLDGLVDGLLAEEAAPGAPETADGDHGWISRQTPDGSPLSPWRLRNWRRGPGDDAPPRPTPLDARWRFVRRHGADTDGEGAPGAGCDVHRWRGSASEGDQTSRAGPPQSLGEHTAKVVEEAQRLAAALDLPDDLRTALTTAAKWRDRGKDCDRWRTAMGAPTENRPCAKTGGAGGDPRRLEGYRHEFGSFVEAAKTTLPKPTRDLILHLIAAHQGHARPTVPPVGVDAAPPEALEAQAREAALRFARLQRRAPWALAWLEALLRAAVGLRNARPEAAGTYELRYAAWSVASPLSLARALLAQPENPPGPGLTRRFRAHLGSDKDCRKSFFAVEETPR